MQNPFRGLRPLVFWPPFLLLLLVVALHWIAPESFPETLDVAKSFVIEFFGWLFSLTALAAVLICVYVCFSKFRHVKLGGPDAQPIMPMWNWFAITVCTTIAVGILLWSTAEPLSHYHSPPASLQIESTSSQSATFAMATMYLHWTFTPYAIYAAASLTFAFAYYNMRCPYSLGAMLRPILGSRVEGKIGSLIDAICLYSLVAGMAASLGGGILILSGGLGYLFPSLPEKSIWLYGIIALVTIVTFVLSSASGLMNGIRMLSSINTYALFALAIFVFLFGPTTFILSFGIESFGVYLTRFFQMNLFADSLASTVTVDGKPSANWASNWTVFYWAVWFAWTPITACFLGQIARGRTVQEFMLVNFVFPSLFGAAWMAIFGGTALHLEIFQEANLQALLVADASQTVRYEMVTYAIFEYLPMSFLLAVFYVASTFVCFVTSADSNTSAMAAISTSGVSQDNVEASTGLKVVWGTLVGVVAWVMISFADVNGIKTISVLGGLPACLLFIGILTSLITVIRDHETLQQNAESESP